jgi:hypothetical protein
VLILAPQTNDCEKLRRRVVLFTLSAGIVGAISLGLLGVAAADTDNPPDDAVGTIEGDAISLQGPMTVEVVHGQVKTVLRSGNDIRVKAGSAHLDLVEGGRIAICGPAHLSVLKSGGSLTLALDTGIVRVHVETQPSITIYTAQIQAKPISIGDGPQEALIGFDSPGTMCVRATKGAIRLEQQLTGQNVIVPQGGDILLNNGGLEGLQNTGGHCNCDLDLAKSMAPPPEISQLATPEQIRKRDTETAKAPPAPEKPAAAPAKEQPVYKVYMPPLSYDAKAPVQRDEFDPQLIVLVRRVRIRPTLIFQGRVEGDAPGPTVTPVKVAAAKPAPTAPPVAQAPAQTDSVVNRVREFLRHLFS